MSDVTQYIDLQPVVSSAPAALVSISPSFTPPSLLSSLYLLCHRLFLRLHLFPRATHTICSSFFPSELPIFKSPPKINTKYYNKI